MFVEGLFVLKDKLYPTLNLVGSPLNFSESPVKYKKTPPTLGEDTDKILKEFLKLNSSDLKRLKEKKII